ncbi:oligoendopeptidase F [bacterium]|nr:oligoendopeptidase F [bacterium]
MKQRSEIERQYQWTPEHIYKDDAAFEADVTKVIETRENLSKYRGKLADKTVLLDALKELFMASRLLMKLEAYAHRNRDVDMSVAVYQELTGQIDTLNTAFSTASSFIDPELLEMDKEFLISLLEDERFSLYKRYVEGILRNKPHILSKKEERIISSFESVSLASYDTYTTFTSNDMTFPKVELEGEEVEVNMPVYAKYRQSDDRETRTKVFEAFWSAYKQNKNLLSRTLHSQLQYYKTVAGLRNFEDSLAADHHGNELPSTFFHTLLGHVKGILPSLHNYLALKKDILKLPDMGYQDVYAKLVATEGKEGYTYEKSIELIMDAIAPMTDEYKKVTREGMTPGSGWIDVYPSKGKRGGAYMSGEAYDIHPFVLLNHIDDYNSMSTMAHEMGHALHSHYSNSSQPFETSQYVIFVAEVASIFNEMLLINNLLEKSTDKEERIFLLNHFIEMVRSTVFRQMQFAEFEDATYKKVEAGGVLTPDFLNKTYGDTLKEYYGHHKNLMNIEELYTHEWSFVPHFYYNYYVYKYVVGFIGALTLATKVARGDIAPEQYIDGFLRKGSSQPPLEILKSAGVDMTTSEPYELVAELFNDRLKELSELLKS